MNINDLLFQVLHYSINATWLRRNPIYSVYYIMVIFTLFEYWCTMSARLAGSRCLIIKFKEVRGAFSFVR